MKDTRKRINNRFSTIAYIFLAIFMIMSLYFCYFLFFKSKNFINNPYNARISNLSEHVIRGSIKSSDDKILAENKTNEDGSISRVYPFGDEYCHVIGYTTNGMMGVELDENYQLLTSHSSLVDQAKNELAGTKSPGDNIVTTLDSKIQDAAYNAITTPKGAAVVIDPESGDILAEVSKPCFDANTTAENWDTISTTDDSWLINRATQGLYPPGSSFKIISTLAYLRSGGSTEDVFNCQGAYSAGGYTVHCAGNKVHGDQTVQTAFANSCNCVFSQMGLDADISDFKSITEKMLFNDSLPGDFSNIKKSAFKLDKDADKPMIMATAFGQGQTLVSPYHMALIASAVANNGVLMEPHVIDHIENTEGDTVSSTSPDEYGRLMSEDEASTLKECMRSVVTDGTARKAFPSASFTAYGKTGTAEFNSAGDTHSWFVGFAENGEKKVALAVILEDTNEHAYTAANKIFNACFN